MADVTVIVPYRPDGRHRDRAWQWVSQRWTNRHPTWQLLVGRPPAGPWCKAAAVDAALPHADGPLLVIADADVWTDGVRAAVDTVRAGAPWAIPHTLVHRLGPEATSVVLDGTPPEAIAGGRARAPYRGIEGGGIVALPRATYERIPLDPRFLGWGQEDESWGLALRCLAGKPARGTAPLYHLWHDPAPRLNDHVGSQPGHALHVRYQYASRDQAAMRALIDERKGGV